MVFDTDGYLLVERPAGSGKLVRVQGPLVTQPANAHAIVTEAYNRALIAYSDLKTPVGPDQRLRAEHAGAGPVWAEASRCILADVHGVPRGRVRATNCGGRQRTPLPMHRRRGRRRDHEPAWPLSENATVTDGGVTWEELTPVLVNRLPAPNSPQPGRVAGGGAFAAGRDVYLEITYVNAQGESIASAPGILVNTNLNDAARVHGSSLVQPGGVDSRAGCSVSAGIRQRVRGGRCHGSGSALFGELCPGRKFCAWGHGHGDDNGEPGLRRHRRIPLGSLRVDCSPHRHLPSNARRARAAFLPGGMST